MLRSSAVADGVVVVVVAVLGALIVVSVWDVRA